MPTDDEVANDELPGATLLPLPSPPPMSLPVAACFVVQFDSRSGYDLSWHRAVQGLSLDGVEYKALPSGLHHVKSDFIYFVQERRLGFACFEQRKDLDDARGVSYWAFGVVVEEEERERVWVLAQAIQRMLRVVIERGLDETVLERFWEENRDQGKVLMRSQGQSLLKDQLVTTHPLLRIKEFLDVFGPLVFPLVREVVLGADVLLVSQPPMLPACEYVFLLSILAAITDDMAAGGHVNAGQALQLFCIGLHDLPESTKLVSAQGSPASSQHPRSWIACSADEILLTKPLAGVRVKLSHTPTPGISHISARDGRQIFATRRDVRRYEALMQSVAAIPYDDAGFYSRPPYTSSPDIHPWQKTATNTEIPTWAATAYESYSWWLSPARLEELDREFEVDSDFVSAIQELQSTNGAMSKVDLEHVSAEMIAKALVIYFRRTTAAILEVVADIVKASDVERGHSTVEDNDDQPPVVISAEAITAMGLDPWSEQDCDWLVRLAKVLFRKEAICKRPDVELCGVKIC